MRARKRPRGIDNQAAPVEILGGQWKRLRRLSDNRRIILDLRDTRTYPLDLQQWVLERLAVKKKNLTTLAGAPSYLTSEHVLELEKMIEQHKRYIADEKKREMGVSVADRETWTEEMDEWWRALVRGEEAEAADTVPDYLTEEEVRYLLLEARGRREFLEKKYPVT